MTTQTPGGALPASDARPAPDGMIWSLDGSRTVREDSVAGALELNLYCIRAYMLADSAAWYEGGGAGDLGSARALARLDKLQALRTLCVLLPLCADLYDAHDLPTSAASEAMGPGLSLAVIRDPSGRVLRKFPETESWRAWAFELEREYLWPAGIRVEPPTLGAAPLFAWWIVALVSGAIIAGAVAWAIGRITDYAGKELEIIDGRLKCFDRWAAEYAETGSVEAREAMLRCHEQSTALAARRGFGPLATAAALGIVGIALLSSRSRD